tara:strand:- start:298 stop:831 length:534 start_codon:yes stop_codon:yes gene_type:complete
MSNLRLINETEITSAINTLNITDIFTDDFDIYVIEGIDIAMTNGGGDYLFGRVINSSGSEITSNYDYASGYIPSSGSALTEERLTSRTEWESLNFIGAGTDDIGNITMYIFNPTNSSSYTFYLLQGSSFRTPNTINYMWKSIGVQKSTTSVTGIQFSAKTGNMDSGKFRTYGLRVDS